MIEVFDNVLIESHREQVYMFSIMADYKIGWDDTATFEHRQYPCLHHSLTPQEWQELDFIGGLQVESLYKELDDLLKPNIFKRFFTWLSYSIQKIKSYRISFKIVRK